MTTPAIPQKRTVFLIAQPTISRRKLPLNLGPLYEHGEVQVVLPMSDKPSFSPAKCYDVMAERLARFNPETDFLVWAGGDTLSAVMVGMILVNQEEPVWRFTWLRYERFRKDDGTRTDEGAKYVPVVIDLYEPDLETEVGDEMESEDVSP